MSKEDECFACGSEIDRRKDPSCKALGHIYHADCFRCDQCDQSLVGKQFFSYKGTTLCKACYQKEYEKNAKRCAQCGKPIYASILSMGDKHFHPECFFCSECKQSLDGVRFIPDKNGNLYCVPDYHNLFLPKCAACVKPIVPHEGHDEARHIISDGKEYHLHCYRCKICHTLFDGKGDDSKCYPLNGALYCFKCHYNIVLEMEREEKREELASQWGHLKK